MSVDIYVMPLTRFKSGEFESPLQQAIGPGNVTRVTRDGVEKQDYPEDTILESLQACIARDAISQLDAFLGHVANESSLDPSVMRWNDEGDSHFAEQAICLEAARTYAYWLSFRDSFPEFEVPNSQDFYSHPVWELDDKQGKPIYQHIALHDHFDGYYLPCDFPEILTMEIDNESDYLKIGSSIRLREELVAVGKTLNLTWQPNVGLVDESEDRDEVMSQVIAALEQLSRAAEASCKHGLPIIFDG